MNDKYLFKIAGKIYGRFDYASNWEDCADAIHQNHRDHGVSIGNSTSRATRIIEYFVLCEGDISIIRRYLWKEAVWREETETARRNSDRLCADAI